MPRRSILTGQLLWKFLRSVHVHVGIKIKRPRYPLTVDACTVTLAQPLLSPSLPPLQHAAGIASWQVWHGNFLGAARVCAGQKISLVFYEKPSRCTAVFCPWDARMTLMNMTHYNRGWWKKIFSEYYKCVLYVLWSLVVMSRMTITWCKWFWKHQVQRFKLLRNNDRWLLRIP